MLMLPLLNSIFIYQALIPQFICGIYCFLRKIAAICWHNSFILITPQKYEKDSKLTNILRDICYIRFSLVTQTMILPQPINPISEVPTLIKSINYVKRIYFL